MNSCSNWHGSDPDVMLALAVIDRAQRDVLSERVPLTFRQSAARFFKSGWYQALVRFVLEEVECVLWGDGYPEHVDEGILDSLLSEVDKS